MSEARCDFNLINFFICLLVVMMPVLFRFNSAEAAEASSDQLINRIKILTKENDRLKNLAETYEDQISKLEDENKKSGSIIKQLQEQLTQKSESSKTEAVSNPDDSRLTQELADTHYNLGVLYQEQGKYDQAQMEYNKVLLVKPEDADTYYNLAVINDVGLGDKEEAIYYYRKYLELNPQASDKSQVEDLIQKLLAP